jgi:hypothetical protein
MCVTAPIRPSAGLLPRGEMSERVSLRSSTAESMQGYPLDSSDPKM